MFGEVVVVHDDVYARLILLRLCESHKARIDGN